MRIAGKAGMRDVYADPAGEIQFLDPDIDPGMAFGMAGAAGIDIAGDIAHRDIPRVAAGDE